MTRVSCDLCGTDCTGKVFVLKIETPKRGTLSDLANARECDICGSCARTFNDKIRNIVNNYTWRHGKREWTE